MGKLTIQTAFSQDTIKRNKYLIASRSCVWTYRENGKEIPYTGYAYTTYLSGKRKKLLPCQHGILEGTAKAYYRNGRIKFEEEFKYGESNGKVIMYNKSGTKISGLKQKMVYLMVHKFGMTKKEE